MQLFQNIFFDHDPNLIYDSYETGASVLLRGKLGPKWEPEILWIQGLNQGESLIRPRITWHPRHELAGGVRIRHLQRAEQHAISDASTIATESTSKSATTSERSVEGTAAALLARYS